MHDVYAAPLACMISFLIGMGNTLEAVLGVFILNFFMGQNRPFLSVSGIFKFIGVAFICTLISATIGATVVACSQNISWGIFKLVWGTWWLADSLSILIFLPLIQIALKHPFKSYSFEKIAELIFILIIAFVINLNIFNERHILDIQHFPTIFLLLPLMVWATYRFNFWGTALISIVSLLMGFQGTMEGFGPFAAQDLSVSLLLLQIFIGIITLTGLTLASALHERRKAEEELLRSSERFQALVENSQDMIALIDDQARLMYVSPSTTKILGYSANENLGHSMFEYIHPEDQMDVMEILKPVFSAPKAISSGRCRYRHKNGSWRWLEGTAYNLLEEPAIKAIVINYWDITDRKESEDAKLYLASIIENSDDAIIGKDLNGVITSWNKGAQKLYGYSQEEIIGSSIEVLMPDEKKYELKEIMKEIKEGKKPPQLETIRVSKSGHRIEVLVTVSPIKDSLGRLIGASAIAQDITKLKLAEKVLKKIAEKRSQELVTVQKELQHANRLADIGTLAATVAHELRNPLGVIQMATYNLRRKQKDIEMDKHLMNIEKKVWEGNQIINNLLSYSRIKIPKYERVNLLELLDECVINAQTRFEGHHVEVEKDYETSCYADADPNQMREVFLNILNNAYQAFPNDTGKIALHAYAPKGGLVFITIKDNGCGIERADLDKIFLPFFTKKSKGTGLGLAICSEMVNLHGGKIEVESEINKGTTFKITLPPNKKADIPEEK
jgi:PAS domain S-box-containing protein